MEIPDVKKEAHNQIDNVKGSIMGMVQIIADDTGHISVCVAGMPEIIVYTLAKTMNDNHQIRDLFKEALYRDMQHTEFKSSLN